MRGILPFLVVLVVAAFFTRAEIFFYLLYTLFGIYVLGRLWARRSLAAVALERSHDQRVFFGQTATVRVKIRNRGMLPVLWLRLADTIPSELLTGTGFRQVLSLRPHERQEMSYTLHGRRRGYYHLGPFVSSAGDLLGTATYENRQDEDDHVTIYPRIVPLRDLGFPSQSPFGTLPSQERVFEDPTRVQGVREYAPGDSLRRIDWKTSARVGGLQVRRYQPAIALETAVLLNLSAADYTGRDRFVATELGIVVAASVAVHVAEKRQAVGLVTNGRDPLQQAGPEEIAAPASPMPGAGERPSDSPEPPPKPTTSLPLRKGREHVMHLLDLLARVEVAAEGEAMPFLDLLSRKSLGLPWGSTALVITGREVEGLLDTLVSLRRRGLAVILVLTCPDRQYGLTAQRASQIGIQTFQVWAEQDMDVWR